MAVFNCTPKTHFIHPFMVITECFLYADCLENSIRTTRYKMQCCPLLQLIEVSQDITSCFPLRFCWRTTYDRNYWIVESWIKAQSSEFRNWQTKSAKRLRSYVIPPYGNVCTNQCGFGHIPSTYFHKICDDRKGSTYLTSLVYFQLVDLIRIAG